MRQRNPLIEEKPAEGDTVGPTLARPSRISGPWTMGNDKRFDALRQRSLSRRRRRCAHSTGTDVRDEMRVAERSSSRRGSRVVGVDGVDGADLMGGIQQSFEEDVFPPVDFAFDLGMRETMRSDSSDMSSLLETQTPNLLQSQDWTSWFDDLQHISTTPPMSCTVDETATSWDSPRATLTLTPGPSSSPALSTSPPIALTATPASPLRRAISLRGPTGDWEAVIAIFDHTTRHSLLSQRTADVLGLNLVPLPWTEAAPRMTPFGIVYPQYWAHNVGVRCGAGSGAVPASIIVAPFDGQGADVLIGCRLTEKLRGEGKGAVIGGIGRRTSLSSYVQGHTGRGSTLGRVAGPDSLSSSDGGDSRKISGLGGMDTEYQGDLTWQESLLDFVVPSTPVQPDAQPIPSLLENFTSISSGNETFQTPFSLDPSNAFCLGDSPGNRRFQ